MLRVQPLGTHDLRTTLSQGNSHRQKFRRSILPQWRSFEARGSQIPSGRRVSPVWTLKNRDGPVESQPKIPPHIPSQGFRGVLNRELVCQVALQSPSESHESLTGRIPWVIPSEQIAAGCQETGLSETQYLTSQLKLYTALARPPISNFRVAAIGLGESGRGYAGVNLEIPGVPLHHSVHAEQFVVANALQHGETKIRQIVVNHAPCGHCRQFLQELRNAKEINILIADRNAEASSLEHFLPHRFGPQDLLHDDFPLLLEPRDNRLTLSGAQVHPNAPNGAPRAHLPSDTSASAASNGAAKANPGPDRSLAEAALAAANLSYAPYSHSPSGVALRLRTGEIFSGAYLESAAYNPSLPPLQSAMVAVVSQAQAEFSEIAEVALVEIPGAQVQFADTVRLSVQKLSPGAVFSVWSATGTSN